MKRCPTCGREYPPEIWVTGQKRKRLIEYLLQHPNGATVWNLMDYIYADDPAGGPDTHNIISVMVKRINELIAPQGYHIRATGGPGSTYHLVRIDDTRREIESQGTQVSARDRGLRV